MQAWMRQARERQKRHMEAYTFGGPRDEARQAYAQWFGSLEWDWFATFTVPTGGRESAAFIWRAHDRWSRVMHDESGRQLRQVVALEWQRRGTAHLHALTFGTPNGSDVFHAMKVWESCAAGGFARIHPYNPEGGAASYCSKYVTKDMELRLIGPWRPYTPPSGQRRLPLMAP